MNTVVLIISLLFLTDGSSGTEERNIKDCSDESVIAAFKDTVIKRLDEIPQNLGKIMINLNCNNGEVDKTFILEDKDQPKGDPT